MTRTEAYKEHIEYTFNAFCRIVIRYAAINAWRDRDLRLRFNLVDMEREAIYFRGHTDAVAYLKKIKAI